MAPGPRASVPPSAVNPTGLKIASPRSADRSGMERNVVLRRRAIASRVTINSCATTQRWIRYFAPPIAVAFGIVKPWKNSQNGSRMISQTATGTARGEALPPGETSMRSNQPAMPPRNTKA